MFKDKEKTSWASSLGFILASAGSAVGLGNIWRFPYVVGNNGGLTFIIVYLIVVFFFGFFLMLAEMSIGRIGNGGPFVALGSVSPLWGRLFAAIGMLASVVLLGFYSVVGGWVIHYFLLSLQGHFFLESFNEANAYEEFLGTFLSDGPSMALWGLLFLALTFIINYRGVRQGIERVSVIFMPLLLVILIALNLWGFFYLSGGTKAIAALLEPSQGFSIELLRQAVAQAFFSLSLGTFIMLSYASYASKNEDFRSSAFKIVSIDTLVGFLAAGMIFSLAFSFDVDVASGPSMVFVTVLRAFGSIGGFQGQILSVLFFLLLFFAAITSSIAIFEVIILGFKEAFEFNHQKATTLAVIPAIFFVIINALKGPNSEPFFGRTLFDWSGYFYDTFAVLGGLITCVFVAWVLPKKKLIDSFAAVGGFHWNGFYEFWYLVIKWIFPPFLLFLFFVTLAS